MTGWTWLRGVLPVPITVTAPGVNSLEELTVESQPPDCLGFYQQASSSGSRGRGESGALQWLERLDNIWPGRGPGRLDIDKEIQSLSTIGIEHSIVRWSC